jgi:hypothetical protein
MWNRVLFRNGHGALQSHLCSLSRSRLEHVYRQGPCVSCVYGFPVVVYTQTDFVSRLPVTILHCFLRFLELGDWARVQTVSVLFRRAAWDPFAFCPVFYW